MPFKIAESFNSTKFLHRPQIADVAELNSVISQFCRGEMVNFCERCNIACLDDKCPKCGRKKLRAVTDDDFCFVAQVDRTFGENLKRRLENEDIECVLMPFGSGFRAKFALPLESCLLYVRYKNLEYARQILKEID